MHIRPKDLAINVAHRRGEGYRALFPFCVVSCIAETPMGFNRLLVILNGDLEQVVPLLPLLASVSS